jgi:hypothetical protein
MAYWDQALLSQDQDFIQRTAACAAVEVDIPPTMLVQSWAFDNVWRVAAAPGFADQYASALAASVPNPGRDPAVITDDQLRAAVQAVAAEANPA